MNVVNSNEPRQLGQRDNLNVLDPIQRAVLVALIIGDHFKSPKLRESLIEPILNVVDANPPPYVTIEKLHSRIGEISLAISGLISESNHINSVAFTFAAMLVNKLNNHPSVANLVPKNIVPGLELLTVPKDTLPLPAAK